jgi:hypothetical protein
VKADNEGSARLAWVRMQPAPMTMRATLSCATEEDLHKLSAIPGTLVCVRSHMSIFALYETDEPAMAHEIIESSPKR